MKEFTLEIAILAFGLGMVGGIALQHRTDRLYVQQAHQNEMQANGLEDECKATLQQGQTNISGVAGSVTVTK